MSSNTVLSGENVDVFAMNLVVDNVDPRIQDVALTLVMDASLTYGMTFQQVLQLATDMTIPAPLPVRREQLLPSFFPPSSATTFPHSDNRRNNRNISDVSTL